MARSRLMRAEPMAEAALVDPPPESIQQRAAVKGDARTARVRAVAGAEPLLLHHHYGELGERAPCPELRHGGVLPVCVERRIRGSAALCSRRLRSTVTPSTLGSRGGLLHSLEREGARQRSSLGL